MIDTKKYTVEFLNKWGKDTISEVLGLEFTEVAEDYLIARMPVDHRTHQPAKILHGGASVVLAETLGSVAGTCSIDSEKYYCVGLEINANHIKSVRSGYVYGRVQAIHVGRKTHIWEIRITNEENKLVCISRITLAILEKE